jgi:mannose-6-phosphate isomerase
MSRSVHPFLSYPDLKRKIWGGRKIEAHLGIALPEGERIGEAWMVADLPEGASWVASGAERGKTLHELVRLWGEDLIGPIWRGRNPDGRFPLLVKFLDAQEDLSVQVHPDEAACREFFPNDLAKDESMVVMQADPGVHILHGLKPDLSREEFERLLAAGRVTECLRSVPVAPGDVYRVAPGMAHAYCQGVMVLEVQEPSDSTFRIYDYGRLTSDGQPRPLHLDAARRVLHFGEDAPLALPPEPIACAWGRHERLVDVPAYRIERALLEREVAWSVDPRSAQALVLLEGEAELTGAGERLTLRRGSCAVLPAAVGEVALRPLGDSPALCIATGAGGVAILGKG